jgi:flagellar biosynthetic protein FliO
MEESKNLVNRMKNYYSIIIFIVLFAGNILAFDSSPISFQCINDEIIINLKQSPSDYKIGYYDYGVNFLVKGIKFDNLIIKKFDNRKVVRIIPLSNEQSLIKIEYPLKDLRKHVQIVDSKDSFSIIIKKNIFLTKAEDKLYEDNIKQKNVVDVAKNTVIPDSGKEKIVKNNTSSQKTSQKKNISSKKEDKLNFNLKPKSDKYDFFKNIPEFYGVLFFLCLIILLAIVIFMKRSKSKSKISSSSDLLEIIYKYQIMPKKSIVIVKVFDDYYILGVTDSNFLIIDKVSQDSLKDAIKVIESKKHKESIMPEHTDISDKEKLIKLIQSKLKNYQEKFH